MQSNMIFESVLKKSFKLKVLDKTFQTKFINLLSIELPKSSILGMVVSFISASLDFDAIK